MIAVRVLNLYAGIGGNRKLWEDVEVVAVENDMDKQIVYRDHFPQDGRVNADAHKYLRKHFHEFDFIWSSPPCPTHSRIRNIAAVGRGQNEPVYPDMRLYQEIIFLQQAKKSNWKDWDGHFVVENVRSYYDPLIKPQEVDRHYFWSSFAIPDLSVPLETPHNDKKNLKKLHGFDLSDYDLPQEKRGKMLRNCVHPKIGKHVLNAARNADKQSLERFVTA